jgi:hypothetical protein
MPQCPKCKQFIRESVYTQILECPSCRLPLKAHGHPGIPLHYATGNVPLCQDCIYDQDDTCNLPQRPDAKQCTLYQNQTHLEAMKQTKAAQAPQTLQAWLRQYNPLLWVGVLAIASFLFTLLRSR